MASICNEKNGHRRIAFVDPDGRHRSLRLGKCSQKAAESMRLRIEQLLQDRKFGVSHTAATMEWLTKLPDSFHARLVKLGLVEGRKISPTLGQLIDRFTESQHVKESTMASYKQCTDSLLRELGKDTPLDRITPADGDAWRSAIAKGGRVREKKGPKSLSNATVAKRVNIAKAIFAKAKAWQLIEENPFAHLKSGSQANPDRARYVTVEETEAVLAACPSTEWQVIVALARFAALRCPSEIRELRWSDLDWQRKMLVVRSPKTEGSAGHAVRKVPVSPQLQPLLSKLRRESPPDAERIIRSIRCDALNLRTRFLAIIDRAGLKPWPRLFQNLRASCATDFAQSVPNHEAARFVGHSPTVAAQHYLQPSDHNFQAIAGSGPWISDTDEKSGVQGGVPVAYGTA